MVDEKNMDLKKLSNIIAHQIAIAIYSTFAVFTGIIILVISLHVRSTSHFFPILIELAIVFIVMLMLSLVIFRYHPIDQINEIVLGKFGEQVEVSIKNITLIVIASSSLGVLLSFLPSDSVFVLIFPIGLVVWFYQVLHISFKYSFLRYEIRMKESSVSMD